MARDRPPDSLLSDTHVAASLVVLCGICGVDSLAGICGVSPRPAAAYPDNPVTGLVRIENRYLLGYEQTLRASKNPLRLQEAAAHGWFPGLREKRLDLLARNARLARTHLPPMKNQAAPPSKRKATAAKPGAPSAKDKVPPVFKSKKHLTRFDYGRSGFKGWRLCVIKNGSNFVRYFSDGQFGGPDKSLAAAEKALVELRTLIDISKRVNGKLTTATIRKGQKLLAGPVSHRENKVVVPVHPKRRRRASSCQDPYIRVWPLAVELEGADGE